MRNFRGCWPFSKEKPLLCQYPSLCRFALHHSVLQFAYQSDCVLQFAYQSDLRQNNKQVACCSAAGIVRGCVSMIPDMVIVLPRKVMKKMSYTERETEGQRCMAGERAWHYRTFPTSKLLSS